MPLLNEESFDSDTKALLENDIDDGRKYSSIESETSHTSLHVVSTVSPTVTLISTKVPLNSDTGKATISEEIFNLIKNIVGSVSTTKGCWQIKICCDFFSQMNLNKKVPNQITPALLSVLGRASNPQWNCCL